MNMIPCGAYFLWARKAATADLCLGSFCPLNANVRWPLARDTTDETYMHNRRNKHNSRKIIQCSFMSLDVALNSCSFLGCLLPHRLTKTPVTSTGGDASAAPGLPSRQLEERQQNQWACTIAPRHVRGKHRRTIFATDGINSVPWHRIT